MSNSKNLYPDTQVDLSNVRVDMGRLLSQIDALAAINRQADGSCCRLALTDADIEGRRMVESWMREAGLSIQVDQVGNIFAIRPGTEPGDPVMTGSHIDTVATGGRLDGVLGVMAGLEVARTLNDAGIRTRKPLVIAVFTNEEGVRFQPDMMGSLVFAGGLSVDQAHASLSRDGISLISELKRTDYLGTLPCGQPRPSAYVELHIEQGPILHREGGILGVVENLQGISWQEFTIRGSSNHAGTTPMSMRRDAGYCAAAIAVFVRELALKMGGSQVATVGQVHLSPNLVNVIAREAKLTVDLRNIDDETLADAERRLALFIEQLAQEENVSIEARRLASSAAVEFDDDIVHIIEQVSEQLGSPARRMTSGAGHDAQMIARIAPAAMIFVPSIGGVSHNPREDTEVRHLEIGTNALLHTIVRLAGTDQ